MLSKSHRLRRGFARQSVLPGAPTFERPGVLRPQGLDVRNWRAAAGYFFRGQNGNMQVSFARVFCLFCDKESMSFFNLGSQIPTFKGQVHHWLPERPRTGCDSSNTSVDDYSIDFQCDLSVPAPAHGSSCLWGRIAGSTHWFVRRCLSPSCGKVHRKMTGCLRLH